MSALTRNPNKSLELEISHEISSRGGKEGPREDRGAVDKGRLREAVDNGEQKETSRREITVQGKYGQQKEAVREDSQRKVSIPSGFF